MKGTFASKNTWVLVILLIAAMQGLAVSASAIAQNPAQPQEPTAGQANPVTHSVTAVDLAEKALIKIYGKKKIESERPFTATLSDGV